MPSAQTRHPDRFLLDPTPPTPADAWSDLWQRALLPAVGLFVLVVGLGLLVIGPAAGALAGERGIETALAAGRTPVVDRLTFWWSAIGSTEVVIAGCVILLVVLWWRTGWWWWASVPAVAVALQAAVFMSSALVVGRERPEVDRLDEAPPTSSFPSGHTGAATAFWLSAALLARRIEHRAVRVGVVVVCLAVPALVAFARLYRGMHHPSDVIVGFLNGGVCVWLAWHYLRRRPVG